MLVLRYLIAAGLFWFGTAHAQATAVPSDDAIVEVIMKAMESMNGDIAATAVKWLSSFMLLQFIITNYKSLVDNIDLEQLMAKLAGTMLWFGVAWYILDAGPAFINDVGVWFLGKYSSYFPSVSGIILSTTGIAAGLTAIAAAIGAISNTIGFMLIFIIIAVILAGIFLAGKITMLKVELFLIVMTAPFSFSFLGLNALRDQAIAPFKSLISLMYRIMIYAVVSAGFLGVNKAQIELINKYGGFDALSPISSSATMMKYMFAAMIAQALLMYLLFKSDAIAASLSSGSTSLNTADMTAAIATSSAAAAAVGGMANRTQDAGRSISDLMSKMGGQRGEVSARNVSDIGSALSGGAIKPDAGGASSLGGASTNGNAGELEGSEAAETEKELGKNPHEFGGVPNGLPENSKRDPARDAAREARRKERSAGDGQRASIGGSPSDSGRTAGSQGGYDLDRLHQHMERDKVATHVTINTNAT